MLALGGKSFTYDANGNLQTRSDVCGTTTYTWDARNRLTGISGYKPDCSGLTASFSYDALNRRISKTINGAVTQYVYDGWDVIQEINAGVKTNYVRSLNIDEPMTRITGSVIRHYVKDALGSVMALTDDTRGEKGSEKRGQIFIIDKMEILPYKKPWPDHCASNIPERCIM